MLRRLGAQINAVDCTVSTEVCRKYGVDSYPTLKWFGAADSNGEEYSGRPPRYRRHLGCILLKMAAISLSTGGRTGSDIADFVKGKTDPSYSGGGGGGAAEEVEIDKDEL